MDLLKRNRIQELTAQGQVTTYGQAFQVERHDEEASDCTQRALTASLIRPGGAARAADSTGEISPGGGREKDYTAITADLRGCFWAG